MNNKQKLVYLSLIALTIIGILSGASYAYFSVENKIGNETVIESGTMALTFTDGSTITADKLIPGEYIEKTFSVRNTGTIRTNYDIYLSEVVNTFVNQSDLVYEIISSNGYNTSNQVQVPNTETKIINNYPIDPLQEHTYTLRITYKLTNENQNDNMGRNFIAKININEYNQNNSERYIKLYDANNNEIDKQVLTNNSDYYYPLSNINLSNSTNIYCDNGGIPTIENNQLKVSEVTSETNCRISNSINTTINNLPNTKTGIVMTNNQDNVAAMTISSGKEVVLDLNGKDISELSGGDFVVNEGLLRIYNNSTEKGNIIAYSTTGSYTAIRQKGTLIIDGNVHIEGPYGIAVSSSNSSTIINYAEITGVTYAAIQINTYSDVSLTINDGYFYTNDANVFSNYGTGNILINGGSFVTTNSYTIINNGGTININGGSFIIKKGSTSGAVIINRGILNITDNDNKVYIGAFNNANNWGMFGIVNENGTTNINSSVLADDCNANYNSNTKGICVYVENAKGINGHDHGNININNVKVIADGEYARYAVLNINNEIKIRNSYIISKKTNSVNAEGVADEYSKIYICNSYISGFADLYVYNNSGYIYYKSDVNLAHNNIIDYNNPSHVILDNTITCE